MATPTTAPTTAPVTAPTTAPTTGPDAAALAVPPTTVSISMARPLCPHGVVSVELSAADAEAGAVMYRRAMAAGLTPDECRGATARALKGEAARWLRGVVTAPAPKASK